MVSRAATAAVATIDWSRWAGLEPIPLALSSDGDRASPDLVLRGTLPAAGSYSYRLSLDASLEYHFRSVPGDDGVSELAMLVDPASGKVYWTNAAEGLALGLSPEAAAAVTDAAIQTSVDTSLVLLVSGAAAGKDGVDPFLLEVFADTPAPVAPVPTPPPSEPTAAPPPPAEPPLAPAAPTANEIFRFVKISSGMYFYTASVAERELIATNYPEFRLEGPVFVGDDVARDGWAPVYRFANIVNGGYFYTASEAERASILQSKPQLRPEGISFWVPGEASASTMPVYRLMNLDTGGYLFTTNPAEKLYALLQGGWRDEGVAFNSLKSLDSVAQLSEPMAFEADTAAWGDALWGDVPLASVQPAQDLFGLL